jgi:hypothetical protein
VLLADSVENAALDGIGDDDESDDDDSDEDDDDDEEEGSGSEQRAHRARMRRLTELMPMLAWLCEQPGVNELTCRRQPPPPPGGWRLIRRLAALGEEAQAARSHRGGDSFTPREAQAARDADAMMAEVTRLVSSAIATAVAEGGEGEGLADAMATLDMNKSTLEARFDDETLDDETLDDETLNTLEAQFDQHLERAVAQGRLSEAVADAMTDQIASKPNNAARCEAMRRIMKGEIGEIGLKGGQGGGENEPNRSEGDARDDGARHGAPELTLLQFMEEIDRDRAEHASKAPETAPNWFGLNRRRPPPPPQQQQQQPPQPPQQQPPQPPQQAVLAKGPSPFARLLRLEPSERGKVVDALSSLPTWGGGNIEGLTLVAGRWEPSSFSGETLDVALFNAEVQSKTLVD